MKKWCVFLLTTFFVTTAGAQPGSRPGPGMNSQGMPSVNMMQRRGAQPLSAPAQVVVQGMEELLQFLRAPERPDNRILQAFVDGKMARYFDFSYMTKWVAGPAWRSMSPAQRQQFSIQFKQQFLEAMVQRLSGYNNQGMRLLRTRPSARNKNEATVSIGLLNARGYPAKIDFRMYKSARGWKVFDVVAAGSSALIFYRKQMRQMLQMQRANMPTRGR